ncbi:MAG: histidine phosphatase family protein [Acidobacteria bacterium]|nr:histidine phosphatase family protein [Acidobacteriota bacterium]
MKTVLFWVMRHGQRNGDKDELTEQGFEQVRASAKHNLSSLTFDAAFFSGMHRVRQTAETVLTTLGQSVPLVADQGFGFGWAADEKRWPFKEATRRVEEAKAGGAQETADLWLEQWPPALMVRGRLLATLLLRAQMLADASQRDTIRVLVGSHSPTSELAALDPKTTLRLRETDIMHYAVEVGGEGPKLVTSEVVRAPY